MAHMKKLTIIILLLISLGLNAQVSPLIDKYKQVFPNAQSVRLWEERNLEIDFKDGEILITQNVTEENLYLNDAATFRSKESINFSSFYELESVEASSYLFDNGKYKELKVKDFVTKDDMGDSFYDDSKSINFIYPNLQSGSKSKLSYKQKIKNPRFLGAFFLGGFEPIINGKFTITVDKNINLEFKEFNIENVDILFSKEEKRGKNIFSWEVKNLDKFEYDPDAPDFRNTIPHIVPIIANYEKDGHSYQILGEVKDLYSWYYSLVKDVNKDAPTQDLVNITNTLIKDKNTDLEKVKAIYYWVQENIKYIAFEYALGGFIPRKANDVFKKKYGDCKDNSSILQEMLEIAGLQGNLTWIGTRSIPYTYDQLPTPAVDNHMILTYRNGEKVYYLDATGRYIPIDLPSSFIQGKEALVAIDQHQYEIQKVPVVAPEVNMIKDSININIDGDILRGTGLFNISGYAKIDFFNRLESIKKQEDLNDFYINQLSKGNNKFLIDYFKETNKFDYEKNFIVDYSFNIQNYLNFHEDEIYINLNFNNELGRLRLKDDRKTAKEYRYKTLLKSTVNLIVPDDKEVAYIPENFNAKTDFSRCRINYKRLNNIIEYQFELILDFLVLEKQQQKQFNAFLKDIEKNLKEVIVLKNKS